MKRQIARRNRGLKLEVWQRCSMSVVSLGPSLDQLLALFRRRHARGHDRLG